MEIEEKVQIFLSECSKQISELMGKPVTLVLFGHQSQKKIAFERIVEAVCETTSIPFDKIIKKDRHREFVMTRQLISFYTKYYGVLTHVDVAKELGYKDHTTTISGARKIKDLLDSGNTDVVTAIQKINHQLNIAS